MTTKKYNTKDSGRRVNYQSGMRRDVADGKPRYDLIPLSPLKRLAELYQRGAVKYGDNNWQLANSPEELQRFKASFLRHAFQWLAGEDDEDHAIAAVWNIFAALTMEDKLNQPMTAYEIIEHQLEDHKEILGGVNRKQRKSLGALPDVPDYATRINASMAVADLEEDVPGEGE